MKRNWDPDSFVDEPIGKSAIYNDGHFYSTPDAGVMRYGWNLLYLKNRDADKRGTL